MVDISALMRALPISKLEPDTIASLNGLISVSQDRELQASISLLEPPAGQRVPYIEPVDALTALLRCQGVTREDAKARALDAVARMKEDVAEDRWVNFFDWYEPESPDGLSLPDFVAWLRDQRRRANPLASDRAPDAQGIQDLASAEMLAPPDIVDFLEQAGKVVSSAPAFSGPDCLDQAWSLETAPALPPPQAMIEFMPSPPWDDCEGDWWTDNHLFLRWREAMHPIAQKLETALGVSVESVYYFAHFADLSRYIGDDYGHRFLVLHWCCTCRPESPFVRYLLKVSGARDVEELKAALIDPASYTQPFKMHDSFDLLEAYVGHIDYLPPEAHRTVGVVFLTAQAREVAQRLLAWQIGAHAFIVAPRELATDEWVEQATRTNRDWTVRYVDDGKLDEPLDILASVDELYVIANEPTPTSGFDLKLSDPAEDLLWLARDLGVEVSYCQVRYAQSMDYDDCLQKRGVPERMAARKAQRAAFTRQLKEIRLDNDFGSSGLWDGEGRNLGYDQLDLPFPLVRRIAAWQRDYDDTMNPPEDMGDDAWWERHEQEAIDLAKALQTALGENTLVKLPRKRPMHKLCAHS